MIAERSARLSAAKPSPRQRKQKLEREEQILSAALEEFGANGYAATRLEDGESGGHRQGNDLSLLPG